MEDAINLPLYFIRLKLKSLDPKLHYVVCCDTGRRSSAAAYILAERGLNASVLKGGLSAADVARLSARHNGAGHDATSCASACRRRGRRPDSSRSSAACYRDPAR